MSKREFTLEEWDNALFCDHCNEYIGKNQTHSNYDKYPNGKKFCLVTTINPDWKFNVRQSKDTE